MSLAYKSTVPLSGLAVPLFVLLGSVLFELTLQLSALISLSLSFGISFVPPTVAIALGIVVALAAAFTVAIDFGLPSFNLNLSLAFSVELAIVLGLLAEIDALLVDADLVAYGWFGAAPDLGAALTSAVGAGWPDGTGAEQSVTVYLLVATTTSTYRADQIESLSLVTPPPPPPAPASPPLPDGTPYPPPQAYETGLAGVSISPPTSGTPGRGVVVVDDSVATGIGAITGVSIIDHGSGYTSPPTITITDTVPIVSATTSTPSVLTLPFPLTIPTSSGFGVSVADASTPPVTISATAKVLTPTTIALYSDQDMTTPITGSFAGGTVTGGGVGAAGLATMGGGSSQAAKVLFSGLKWPDVPGVLEGGVISLLDMLPGVFATILALQTSLEARAALLGGASASATLLPPTVAASIDLLGEISANLSANLTAELPDLSVSMGAALDAQLSAVAALQAGVGLYMGIAGAELEVWEYTGPGSGLGAAVSAGPGVAGWRNASTSTPVSAAIIGLTNPAASAAFGAFFPGA